MLNGFLGVIKPSNITSHDVVIHLRKLLGFSKIGHLGTLDPLALGVLPVALGKAARLIEFLPPQVKVYLAEVTLGYCTDTGDTAGNITAKTDFSHVTKEKVLETLNTFCGLQEQTPPIVSAVHYKGNRAYKLARNNEEVKLKARTVYIKSIELLDFQLPKFFIKVECGPGVYIRSLCYDIGKRLKTLAVLSYLKRIKSGFFTLNSSYTLEEIEFKIKKGEIGHLIVPPEEVLKNIFEVTVKSESLKLLLNGVFMERRNLYFIPEGLKFQQKVIFKDQRGSLLAVGEVVNDKDLKIKPIKVLSVNRETQSVNRI